MEDISGRVTAWPQIVESFPLTVRQIFQKYTKVPADASHIFYHYTTHAGLKGILKSGGFRATYRMKMNDTGEFAYARNVVYEALNEVGKRHDLPKVAEDLTTYTRINLEKFLDDTTKLSSAYCACLTVSPDDPQQWKTYADLGKGFAIGFNMPLLLSMKVPAIQRGDPYVFCAPVTYNRREQYDLVWHLLKAGICDLQTFTATVSKQSQDLTALRNRITLVIVAQLFSLIDFIKNPTYNSEREMRLILDPNDGTLMAPPIQHYQSGNESIPFIFMDLRNPKTRRLPLAEIKIGPNASFLSEETFLKDLLDDLGYGRNCMDRPQIIGSSVRMVGQ